MKDAFRRANWRRQGIAEAIRTNAPWQRKLLSLIKSTVVGSEIYRLYALAGAASVKRANVSEADVQQPEAGPEQIPHLEDAVQFYGKSLANYYDVDVARRHKHNKEVLRRAYNNPQLSRDALVKGNEFFRKGEHNKKADFLSSRF